MFWSNIIQRNDTYNAFRELMQLFWKVFLNNQIVDCFIRWVEIYKSEPLIKRCTEKSLINYECPISLTMNEEPGFVGISVNGRSPFLQDPPMASKLVKFFKEQKREILILIADEIAQYNFQAFDNYDERRAIQKANEMGLKIYERFQEAIQEHNCSEMIQVCRWSELQLPDMMDYLLDTARTEKDCHPSRLLLHQRVHVIGQSFIQRRGGGGSGQSGTIYKKSLPKKIEFVKKYIFSELPVLICGISYEGKWYRTLYYSGSLSYLEYFTSCENSLFQLINDLIEQPEFEEIRKEIMKIMNTSICKRKGFLGVNLDALV